MNAFSAPWQIVAKQTQLMIGDCSTQSGLVSGLLQGSSPNLFSPLANLPTGLYILPPISFFLHWAKSSQDLLERFSRFFFTKWKVFVWMLSIQTSFFRFLKGRCHGNQFWQKWRNDLHLAPWHFKTDWNIAIRISSFITTMIPLHHVQIARTLIQ